MAQERKKEVQITVKQIKGIRLIRWQMGNWCWSGHLVITDKMSVDDVLVQLLK